MTTFEQLKKAFDDVLARFQASPAGCAIQEGRITVNQYQAAMRQIFHQARENPQIQAFATVRFRGRQRESIKRFYQHATSEIGHDQMALNDLTALGVDTRGIATENPAPTTIALTSFAYYQTGNLNPIGYLGYLFFLEFMPTTIGQRYAEALLKAGVPEAALTFLMEHALVDVHHNRLMERYVADLVRSDQDFDEVVYAMRVTGDLYARMLGQALFESADGSDWGTSQPELALA